MWEVIKGYINDEIKLEKWQKICIFCLVFVISGIVGWIYEFIFYYFNGGMKEFYMQGGNFLPWINIYAFGAIFLLILAKKFKKYPLLVFVISFLFTGIFEYLSGLAIYKLLDGARFWDYNVEILNFGNIGGFVCLRSVLIFSLSSLLLIYLIMPFCIYLTKKINKKKLLFVCILIFSIILIDEVYNLIISKVFDLTDAIEFYRSIGINYVS